MLKKIRTKPKHYYWACFYIMFETIQIFNWFVFFDETLNVDVA